VQINFTRRLKLKMIDSAHRKVSIMSSLTLCAKAEGNSLGFQIAHSIGNAKLAHMSATSLCSIFSNSAGLLLPQIH